MFFAIEWLRYGLGMYVGMALVFTEPTKVLSWSSHFSSKAPPDIGGIAVVPPGSNS